MIKDLLYLSLLLLLLFVNLSASFVDPFSTVAVVGTAASSALLMLGEYVGLTALRCKFGLVECCSRAFVQPNITNFKRDLSWYLYGQHIAEKTVFRAVKAHVLDENPSKPLVMSFHGWTGAGKNFVARMIVKNLYAKGEKSSFVHVFNSEVHFKHSNSVPLYKDQLQTWIPGNVSRCSRSIFIFDEIDHMPEGLIDAIKPYLEPQPAFDKVDYRKSIFLFLSNTGGSSIVEHCLKVWNEGRSRNDITLAELQAVLQKSAFNQKNGLRLSGVIHKNLIDHFVPFLPMEREHVQKCIKDELKRVNANTHDNTIRQVMEELIWFPKDHKLYSQSGCKKIAQKVALVLADEL